MDAMTPREIDRLVAEKIMGYERVEDAAPTHPTWAAPNGEDWYCRGCDAGFGPPPYSTAIAAAWQVMEKMEKEGWHWRLDTPWDDEDSYGAGLTPKGMSGWNAHSDDVFADAPTMSMSICAAGLKAVGVDISSAEIAETTQ